MRIESKIKNFDKFTYNSTSNEDFTSILEKSKKENEKYKKAINSIKMFINEIISNFDSNEWEIDEDLENEFNTSLKIRVPKNISSSDLIKYSDEIFNKIVEFVDLNNLKFLLDELTITLTR